MNRVPIFLGERKVSEQNAHVGKDGETSIDKAEAEDMESAEGDCFWQRSESEKAIGHDGPANGGNKGTKRNPEAARGAHFFDARPSPLRAYGVVFGH